MPAGLSIHFASCGQYAKRILEMQSPFYDAAMNESQHLSQFVFNLNTQRDRLGLEVKDIAAELNRRGFPVAYPTVAGWFNGNRGGRWKVDELYAVLEILKTTLEEMKAGEAELVEEPVPAATAREMKSLTPEQQQSVLALVRTMQK